jgi:cystathionine beta-lyase/cystathionine gamma-synthase
MKQHPKVESILFPFDESFPQYELAKQQMKGACGLFTFVLKTDKMESIVKFCESLQHIMMAVSWGGHESLVIPKCAGIEPKILIRPIKNIAMSACTWTGGSAIFDGGPGAGPF